MFLPFRLAAQVAIEGCVAETRAHPCGAIRVGVRLEPLGIVADYGSLSPRFRFEGIPEGDYVLTVPNHCNPFGCWPRVPLSVRGTDVFVNIPILPFCPGDCDNDYVVSVSELATGVRILLGSSSLQTCREFDQNGDSRLRIGELVAAVSSARGDCPNAERFRIAEPGS
jgi:hypothetical protein